MSDTELIGTVAGTVVADEEFVYPKEYFLQIVKEEIYRCNRKNQCFLWIEIPLKGFVYDGFGLQIPLNGAAEKNSKILEIWKLAVQTMLSKEYAGIMGQGKNCLWSLYTNKNVQFLEELKSNLAEKIEEAGLSEYIPVNFNFCGYFYSGRAQSFVEEENRFIKKWNSETHFLKMKRISVENVKEKKIYGLFTRGLKRLIDIIGSLFGMIIFFGVMLICAIIVKHALLKWESEQKKQGKKLAESPSILFKQIRVGRDGKLFRCYKFRTMYPGADLKKEELKKQRETKKDEIKRGPTFKMSNDPRVLKYGCAFLRKHSLDELPQFYNVLKGEMSLVGPRPPTPDEVREYEAWHYIRLSIKPGLTCIWQISGRNDVDFDEWMRLDNKYIHEHSILKDLNLKLKTIEVMFNGKGAS
jgi:lipopolysaccharide/colanic/teichoic acid biosynthesis glycosyltransferase